MLMIMTAAAMLVMVMVMLVMMLMIMTAAAMLVMVMVMLMMMVVMLQLLQSCRHSCLAFHCMNQLVAIQFAPGSCNNGSVGVMFAKLLHSLVQLSLRNGIGTGQNDGIGRFHLVVVELAKILHIDLYLTGIHNRNGITQFHALHLLDSSDHIGQLAHTGGFNDNTVGSVLMDDLLQSLTEVTHQTAADAAGVHLGNVDTGLLEEAAVNADFAKFILNENKLLALVAFRDHFLDQRSLTCAQKTRINIDGCHSKTPSVHKISIILYHPFR